MCKCEDSALCANLERNKMVTKEVLAKLNEVIALSVTKRNMDVGIKGYLSVVTLEVRQVQDDYSSVYQDGTNQGSLNWIRLECNPNCLEELNETLEWLETLPNKWGE